jgi:hypothetical protein
MFVVCSYGRGIARSSDGNDSVDPPELTGRQLTGLTPRFGVTRRRRDLDERDAAWAA